MTKKYYQHLTFGDGSPRIAIVGCTHGDEPLGKFVIGSLIKDIIPIKGSISFFIAHPLALKKKKRFIEQDLNRSFPGKMNGKIEERIAYELKKTLSSFDVVIDIHATNSNIDSLAIVTKQNKKVTTFLNHIPIKKIGLARSSVFGGHELINHTKMGVALEYGPDKKGTNHHRVTQDIKHILINLGIIAGVKKSYPAKEIYTITDQYHTPKKFKASNKLKDFQLIRKGQMIGMVRNKKIYSDKNFYPLFLGKGKYKGTLALVADKVEVKL